jgi:hypothetical protein
MSAAPRRRSAQLGIGSVGIVPRKKKTVPPGVTPS